MKQIIIIIFFLSVYSCTTQRKAEKFFNANEDVAAGYCAMKFPIRVDTIVVNKEDTILLKEYLSKIDSIEIIDTICLGVKEKIKYIIKNKPPQIKEVIVTKENTAKVIHIQNTLNKKEADLLFAKERMQRLKQFNKALIGILIFILLLVISMIYVVIKNRL